MILSPPMLPEQPPALVASAAYPFLLSSVLPSLSQQTARISEHSALFRGRLDVIERLSQAIRSLSHGVIALQGAPGEGVSSLLSYLAACNPFAFWFGDDALEQGLSALCVQLIGLYHLDVPLVPPAADHDPHMIERVLDAVSARCSPESPAVILIDPPMMGHQQRTAFARLMPARIPPHIIFLVGTTPNTSLLVPFAQKPATRLTLPHDDNLVQTVLHEHGCPNNIADVLLPVAQGNILYAILAWNMTKSKILNPTTLQPGLDFLYQTWWQTLAEDERRLALLVAAAGEPIPANLCRELRQQDPDLLLNRWQRLGLIKQATTLVAQRQTNSETGGTSRRTPYVFFTHPTITAAIAQYDAAGLMQAHSDVVALARQEGLWGIASDKAIRNPSLHRNEVTDYLLRHIGYHTTHAHPAVRDAFLPLMTGRSWVRYRQRMDGTLSGAFADGQWELRFALDQLVTLVTPDPATLQEWLVRVGRDVVVVGTLASLTRTLQPETAVAALEIAREQLGKDQSLKRVQEIVDQLPDGADKAQVLRQLGESCYAVAMRNAAMRLLSQALDLEELRVPPSRSDQRDQLLLAMVETVLQAGNSEAALHISELLAHREHRGIAETQVVRWLLRQGELVRARKVATAILHESLTAWAQAEVVVAVARAGNSYNAEMLLGDIAVETASAWAQIELACDIAKDDLAAAQARLQRLGSVNQQNHGYARLVVALAQAGHYAAVLPAADSITDVSVRVQALIHLRDVLQATPMSQESQATQAAYQAKHAMLFQALQHADAALSELAEDMRVPLVALLAAAYAALGYRAEAYGVATQLPEGEERDRALSRIAVALFQHGDYTEGLTVARALVDDDERDWTLAEVTQVLADHGHWQEAQARAMEIVDERDRARTLANLAIAMARLGAPLAGLQLSRSIHRATEQGRALLFIAPLLVQSGYTGEALQVFDDAYQRYSTHEPDSLSFTQLYRYLAAMAIAVAEQGNIAQALQVCERVPESIDQARVYLAIAQVAATQAPTQAYAAFGKALRFATIERGDAFRLLELAIPVVTKWGGVATLVQLAEAVCDVDSWIV